MENFDILLRSLLAPLESGTMAIGIADATAPDIPLIRVNAAFCELTGYAESELVGRNCRFLQGPMTDRAAVAMLGRSIAAGEPARAVLWNYRRDGTPFLNECILTPIRDQAGRLRYYTAVLRELVAGHAGNPRAVRFALAPDGTIQPQASPDGHPANWFDALAAGERRRLAHAAASVAGAQTESPCLSIKIDKFDESGRIRSEMLAARAVRGPGSVMFEGTLSETGQDAALLARLRMLQAVAGTVNDGIIITEAEPFDEPGPRMVYCNEAVCRLSGWTQDQLIGRSPRIFQGPLTDPDTQARIGKALRAWQPVTAQLLNYRADGSTFWIDLSIVPLADEYGWWTNWVAVQRDESERRAASDKIAFQAMHDPLTGLANRRKVYAEFEAALRRSTGGMGAYGLVHLDVDRLKSINDTYGHAAGDALLIETARRLNGCSRVNDVVSRIGGDEFLVLLPRLGSNEALSAVAERFHRAVTGPFNWNGQRLAITASMGVALYPSDGTTLDELMAASDSALYRAKHLGRGRIAIFSPGHQADASAARELGAALRLGLERGEFEPFFQPQLSARTLDIVGLEALARWRHPQRGMLLPDTFLAIAADAGLMSQLDLCVSARTMEAAARWRSLGLDFGRAAVNLSNESFADPDLADGIARQLAEAGLPASHLTVEMVESVFAADTAQDVASKLGALRQLGISIDLDDFGTGFASLTHLRKFPVDRIKLDRSFVAGIGRDADDEVIVSAIVRLAGSLGLQCVAEGVETVAQFRVLAGLGCDHVQGYLFASPMDEQTTTAWLTNYDEHRGTFAAYITPGRPKQAGLPVGV